MNNDKQTECLRYEVLAQSTLAANNHPQRSESVLGSFRIPLVYRRPYLYYEQCVSRYILTNYDVLEIGAGTGLHTYALVQTGARIVASDISVHSLEVLSLRTNKDNLKTKVADMESLPFDDESFNVVTSAGSLSYGEPNLVDKEIRRVLRPGGIFICVDSLNNNPIYRFNRYVKFIRGVRTKSACLRVPTMGRIQSIVNNFRYSEIRYFGAASFLMPALALIVGQNRAAILSDYIDQYIKVRRSAFKFVLVAYGRT